MTQERKTAALRLTALYVNVGSSSRCCHGVFGKQPKEYRGSQKAVENETAPPGRQSERGLARRMEVRMDLYGPRPILPFLKDRPAVADRFWAKVQVRGPQDCWPWHGSSNRGYGRFKVASRQSRPSHRVAWTLANNQDPGSELVVRHKCDRPECCNPAHLELGTVQDNADDKMRRGRWRGGRQDGEHNGRALLSNDQIGEIVAALQRGEDNQRIARRYPVSDSLISRIRTGRSWQKQAASYGWEPALRYLARLATPSTTLMEGEGK